MAFFAIRLAPEAIDQIPMEDLRTEFPDFAWEKPKDLHITLRFFAEGSPKALEALVEGMNSFATTVKPFSLTIEGAYTFHHGRRGGVLWLGLKDLPEPMRLLQIQLEDLARKLGFEPERRPFIAHATIARYSPSDADAIHTILERFNAEPKTSHSFKVDSFTLMKRSKDFEDRLYRDVAVYTFEANKKTPSPSSEDGVRLDENLC